MQSKKVKEQVATVAMGMRSWTADPGMAGAGVRRALMVGLASLSPNTSSCCATMLYDRAYIKHF